MMIRELADILSTVSIDKNRQPQIVKESASSKFWESPTYRALLRRIWKRKSLSDATSPSVLVALVCCCKGYSFNHRTTKIVNEDLIRYTWAKIDTIYSKFEAKRDWEFEELKRIVSGRSEKGFVAKEGSSRGYEINLSMKLIPPKELSILRSLNEVCTKSDVERKVFRDNLEHLLYLKFERLALSSTYKL